MPVPKVLKALVSLPNASFVEGAVADYVKSVCRGLPGVKLRADRYGNLVARYRYQPPKRTPLVVTSHMDHPGFVALEMTGKGTMRAAFRGGVTSEYFDGARVRFWSDGAWVKGRVKEVTKATPVPRLGPGVSRPEEALIKVADDVATNAPGVWDLPEPGAKGDLFHARPVDNLAGVAAMLTLLQRLAKKRVAADLICLFTRAEEVGFLGAVGAIKAGTVPRKFPVVVLEMSKELPNARIGDGPIIRVGDRISLFNPALSAFCERVAKDLAKRKKKFNWQRKLMDGGACEATAYATYGYQANCICLPLGNYHNMDTARGRLANEYISLTDWQHMVELLEGVVRDKQGFGADDDTLRADLEKSFEKHENLF